MTKLVLPWQTSGARLHLPRDLDLAYLIGRMGVATSADTWPLLFGSHSAGKIGFARLCRLGLLKMFARHSPSDPGWYALAPEALDWVADATETDVSELRVVHGVGRMNLTPVRARNRLWVSLILACRERAGVSLVLFRPEWELRVARTAGTRIVPDAQIVLDVSHGTTATERCWFVELDHGTERLAIWKAKAEAYGDARARPSLYGEARWLVLAIVPRVRRARSVAAVVTDAGAGDLVWLGLQESLEERRALDVALWRADELARSPQSAPGWSLLGLVSPDRDPCPRPRSAADRDSAAISDKDSP